MDEEKLVRIRDLNHGIESKLYETKRELSNLIGEYTGLFGTGTPIVRMLNDVRDGITVAEGLRLEQCRLIIDLQRSANQL